MSLKLIEKINQTFAKLSAWLCLLLVVTTFLQVVARYVFNATSVGMQELSWHLYGAIFLLAAGYVYNQDGHVRIDIFYGKFSPRFKNWINRISVVIFVMPTAFVLVYYGFNFAQQSFAMSEVSPDSGGLPARWLIKSLIAVSGLLVFLQSIIVLVKSDDITTKKEA